MSYPFEPGSSDDLAQGHYWGIPLCEGRHAAGVMLAHVCRLGKRDRNLVLVGLLDWVGEQPPCAADLRAAGILNRAFVHVRAIASCGSLVVGRVERDWGPAEIDYALAGARIPGWGLLAMQYRAEMRWGNAKLMQHRLKAQLNSRASHTNTKP